MQPIPQAASRDGSLQLLELGGPPPADAEIRSRQSRLRPGKNQDAKAFCASRSIRSCSAASKSCAGLSKASFPATSFIFFETRRGVEQHMLLATTLDGYIVRVVLAPTTRRL